LVRLSGILGLELVVDFLWEVDGELDGLATYRSRKITVKGYKWGWNLFCTLESNFQIWGFTVKTFLSPQQFREDSQYWYRCEGQ
jgi:hypothetical protein